MILYRKEKYLKSNFKVLSYTEDFIQELVKC